MDRRRGRTGGKRQATQEWIWFAKMLVLMVFIMVMLVVGRGYDGGVAGMRGVVKRDGNLAQRLGVVPKDPWRIDPADLNRRRVLYNWLTKPGYRDLLVYSGLGVAGLWLMARGMRWAYKWQRQMAGMGVTVEIAGTVRISAERGIIYVSAMPETSDPMQSYSFVIRVVPIRLVATSY